MNQDNPSWYGNQPAGDPNPTNDPNKPGYDKTLPANQQKTTPPTPTR